LKLTEKEVGYVAELANLSLTEAEIVRLSQDLGQILTHIEQLNQLDTTNVQPMAQVLYDADETATLREDIPHISLSNEEALVNSAASGSGYYKVPRVIER
jgi:aspartyl-tRNA(Asn)/glutamyl-tRNA(Gln) amidotransferase subunit C